MSKWRQVGGDMTWERHGLVLAKVDGGYVELVRVLPWLEHDAEAAVSHGLYLVDSASVPIEDLDDAGRVAGALRSLGMSVEEYEELQPEYKAQALVDYDGYEDSRSVDRLAEALPVRPEEIEFWGGKETAAKLAEYDDETRRESLEANFDTRFSFGEMPSPEALAFALGGEGLDIELKGEDALAFEYATQLAGVPGATGDAEEFAETVKALAAAPDPAALDEDGLAQVADVLSAWERRYGDPSDEERGIVQAAAGLASSLLASIGFEWV